jgi:uncharacterized protein YjbI with pentapeptide repeats
MIKRKEPIIKFSLSKTNKPYVYEEDQRIEYQEFSDINIADIQSKRVVFDAVVFNHCDINDNHFVRSEFIDCIFNHCTFTNNRCEDSSFIRCIWNESKLDGTHFINSHLEHILLSHSTGRYLDIADSKLNIIEMIDSHLKESTWFQNKISHLKLKNVSLEKADFYKTSINKVDLSTTEISGMHIELDDIKGAIIDASQAPLLCQLIGVKIKS